MAILGFEIEDLARILALADSEALEELVIEEGDSLLRIRGEAHPKLYGKRCTTVGSTALLPVAPPPASTPALPASKKASRPPMEELHLLALPSPMTGTFYRARQPGSPPLVEVGQRIEIGQSFGLIEAMKVFSEVPAEKSGIVASFPAADGKLVREGDPLVLLRVE